MKFQRLITVVFAITLCPNLLWAACPQLGSAQGASYSKIDGSGTVIGPSDPVDPNDPNQLPNDDVYFDPTNFVLVQSGCALKMITAEKTYEFAYDDSKQEFSNQYQVAWFNYTLTVQQDAVTSHINVTLLRERDFWQSSAPTYGYSADFRQDADY